MIFLLQLVQIYKKFKIWTSPDLKNKEFWTSPDLKNKEIWTSPDLKNKEIWTSSKNDFFTPASSDLQKFRIWTGPYFNTGLSYQDICTWPQTYVI